MGSKAFSILEEALEAFNSSNFSRFYGYFSDGVTLNKYPSVQLARGRTQARKRLDAWLQQYPVTQVEIVSQIHIDMKAIVQLRVTKHPEEPPFDIVLMMNIMNKNIVSIEVLASESNGLTTVL